MFSANTYAERRKILRRSLSSGLVLLPGNTDLPMNYPENIYHFRQDSHFLYFFGLDIPNLMGLMDLDEGIDIIFGNDFSLEEVVWMGPQPALRDLAHKASVSQTETPGQLKERIQKALSTGKPVHYLPPYRAENLLKLEDLLGLSLKEIKTGTSEKLVRAVAAQRSVKSEEEIDEIESALNVTQEIFASVAGMAHPGVYEREIVGTIEGILKTRGRNGAYPIILSVHGEILHNHSHENRLEEGNLLIVDAGSESPLHYASDITRTYPVGGSFSPRQRDIYQLVHAVQAEAIAGIAPGTPYKNIHLKAAMSFAVGLTEIGLMRGDAETAVKQGAHALFFPHGLGHMMGLDVHDMEDIGEDYVGYPQGVRRSSQFGLGYLRLAKELERGNVLTVEPGLYFIPPLIQQWEAEGKFAEWIDYTEVKKFMNFGGIRIEDDVLVTDDGARVLGKPIPKTLDEVEASMA